jgi:hypothetical protein
MAFLCKDPLVTHLKPYGYCTLYPPRASANPLDLLVKSGDVLEPWGNVSLFDSDKPLPAIMQDTTISGLTGEVTASHDLSVGLTILSTLIGVVGGGNLGLKAAYKSAKTLQFQYGGIQSWYAVSADIDGYLSAAKLDRSLNTTVEYATDDDLYVLCRVLKANKITVTALREDQSAIECEVPIIQQAVGGSIAVSADSNRSATITYEGAIHVGFGFQALQIDHRKKDDEVVFHLKQVKPGSVVGRGLSVETGTKYIILDPPETAIRIG